MGASASTAVTGPTESPSTYRYTSICCLRRKSREEEETAPELPWRRVSTARDSLQGKSGPPEGIPRIDEITHNSLSLSWYAPEDRDPGSIIAYHIEKFSSEDKKWQTVTETCQGTTYQVRALTPGMKYIFRVRAENMSGTGRPSLESNPIWMPQEGAAGDVDKSVLGSQAKLRTGSSFLLLDGGVKSILNRSDIDGTRNVNRWSLPRQQIRRRSGFQSLPRSKSARRATSGLSRLNKTESAAVIGVPSVTQDNAGVPEPVPTVEINHSVGTVEYRNSVVSNVKMDERLPSENMSKNIDSDLSERTNLQGDMDDNMETVVVISSLNEVCNTSMVAITKPIKDELSTDETEQSKAETEQSIVDTEQSIIETMQLKVETEPSRIATEQSKIETEQASVETKPSKAASKPSKVGKILSRVQKLTKIKSKPLEPVQQTATKAASPIQEPEDVDVEDYDISQTVVEVPLYRNVSDISIRRSTARKPLHENMFVPPGETEEEEGPDELDENGMKVSPSRKSLRISLSEGRRSLNEKDDESFGEEYDIDATGVKVPMRRAVQRDSKHKSATPGTDEEEFSSGDIEGVMMTLSSLYHSQVSLYKNNGENPSDQEQTTPPASCVNGKTTQEGNHDTDSSHALTSEYDGSESEIDDGPSRIPPVVVLHESSFSLDDDPTDTSASSAEGELSGNSGRECGNDSESELSLTDYFGDDSDDSADIDTLSDTETGPPRSRPRSRSVDSSDTETLEAVPSVHTVDVVVHVGAVTSPSHKRKATVPFCVESKSDSVESASVSHKTSAAIQPEGSRNKSTEKSENRKKHHHKKRSEKSVPQEALEQENIPQQSTGQAPGTVLIDPIATTTVTRATGDSHGAIPAENFNVNGDGPKSLFSKTAEVKDLSIAETSKISKPVESAEMHASESKMATPPHSDEGVDVDTMSDTEVIIVHSKEVLNRLQEMVANDPKLKELLSKDRRFQQILDVEENSEPVKSKPTARESRPKVTFDDKRQNESRPKVKFADGGQNQL